MTWLCVKVVRIQVDRLSSQITLYRQRKACWTPDGDNPASSPYFKDLSSNPDLPFVERTP